MKLFAASVFLSAAHGFVLPQPNLAVEKLVNELPPVGENDPLDLATRTALIPFILYAPFGMQSMPTKVSRTQTEDDEIDYDAPIERQLKVGHIVRRQPFTLGLGNMGTITPPTVLQQAFDLYKPEHQFELPVEDIDEHYYSIVHDECYLGKDCTAHECVDFDPMHKPTAHSH